MSTTVTTLLTGIGFDADALRNACAELQFEVEEYNAWENRIAPAMGCNICGRALEDVAA
jgi:hypothetical protein